MPADGLLEIERNLKSQWLSPGSIDLPERKNGTLDGRGIYARLLERGRFDLLNSIYPYTRKITGKQWAVLVNDYFKQCPPNHYNLNQSAKRFPEFLKSASPALNKKYPYLPELADFEWIELEAMEMDADVPEPKLPVILHTQSGGPTAILALVPVLNPTIILRRYKFPVQAIAERIAHGKRIGKVKPADSFAMCFRNWQTDRALYTDLGEVSFVILENAVKGHAINNPSSCERMLATAIELSPNTPMHETAQVFVGMLDEFFGQGIFVGVTNG